MKFAIIPTKDCLYDKCENMEQLYDNFYTTLLIEFKQLQQENQQLRIQISAREEEYKKLEDNWNELKKMIEKTIIAINELSKEPDSEFNCTMKGTFGRVLNMMDELEKGKSE